MNAGTPTDRIRVEVVTLLEWQGGLQDFRELSTMALENIRYELRPPLAVVTLDRPKVLNALNHLSMTELEQVFLDIRQNADVRAVLLTGAGEKAFVAGADITELGPLS